MNTATMPRRTLVRHHQASVSRVAAIAEECLRKEVDTWPKPGLVSHVDTGSHTDMDASTFYRSARAIRPFLGTLFEAGASGATLPQLRRIGLDAERAMLAATHGVNTHKGAIFGLGLLCAAAGARSSGLTAPYDSLGKVVRERWGGDLSFGQAPTDTHGAIVARMYGFGGARREAAQGFPSIYSVTLPVLNDTLLSPYGAEAVRVQACFSLIAAINDTNLLHRGGLKGLRLAQRLAQHFLRCGGISSPNWLERARAIHRHFIVHRLSAGGSADLLAMSLFVQELDREEIAS